MYRPRGDRCRIGVGRRKDGKAREGTGRRERAERHHRAGSFSVRSVMGLPRPFTNVGVSDVHMLHPGVRRGHPLRRGNGRGSLRRLLGAPGRAACHGPLG